MTAGLATQDGKVLSYAAPSTAGAGSLRVRAMQASAWVLGGYPLGVAIQLARSMILTRLLFPRAFGLMALVNVVLAGIQMCSDVGISASIVQDKEGEEEHFLQTAWTVQALRGIGLWLLTCVLAWPFSLIYNEPVLKWLIPVSGLTFALSGLTSMGVSLARRRMEQGRLTIFAYALDAIGMLTVAALAWRMRSVWAMVIGSCLQMLMYAILSHIFLPGIRHRLRWDRDVARRLAKFGRWVFIGTIFTFLGQQADRLMLGKLVATDLLGIYSLALVVASLPREVITRLSAGVLFPAMAEQFRSERPNWAEKVLQTRRVMLVLSVCGVVGLALCSPLAIRVLYDARYQQAGWMAQLLAIATWFSILQSSGGWVLLAMGDSFGLAVTNVWRTVASIAGCLCGYWLGSFPGFIVGFGIGSLVGHVATQVVVWKRGINILWQDTELTLCAGACVAASLLASRGLGAFVAARRAPWLGDAVGVVIVAGLCAWSGWKLLGVMKRR